MLLSLILFLLVESTVHATHQSTLSVPDEPTVHADRSTVKPVESITNRTGRDSYVDAYKASHGVEITKEKIVSKPSPIYVKPVKISSYGAPDTTYGAPVQAVYPSHSSTPDTKYGVPQVDAKYPEKIKNEMGYPYYGVPHFHHHYNVQPEQITDPEPVEDNGHGGFDLKTVFKFLAKIVVLKVIVKMVYIVMYLLFVPKINLLEMLSYGDTESPAVSDDDIAEEDDTQQEELDDDDSLFRKSRTTHLNYLMRQVSKALASPPK